MNEIMDIGKCTLLKVPYHGRKLDNIEDFIFDTKSISNKIFDRRKISYKTLFPMKNPKFGLKL